MVTGDINKINLSISSFKRMITDGNLYVDKTKLIERFLESASTVQLIARQRRLGKSLNMDMLRCFLTDDEDLRYLFKGLYITESPAWSKANTAPVFYFDFKGLRPDTYKMQIINQCYKHICKMTTPDNLNHYLKHKYAQLLNNPSMATEGLHFLTEVTYELTGKRSYLLIDEYDKLLMENYNNNKYEEISAFETALLSSALKGNEYLEKALLTGVMRISHESMLSGLNNIVTHDVFDDETYTDDYGLTEEEVQALSKMSPFDVDKARGWYNGISIGDKPIYNIYAMMSYLSKGKFGCYWGKSGTMDTIAGLLNDGRRATIARLLNGEIVEAAIADRISLRDLSARPSDQAFYSLLIQTGYLALNKPASEADFNAFISIPNIELKIVWKQFILEKLYPTSPQIRTLFDNTSDLDVFAKNIEYFLANRLSYHDIAIHKDEAQGQVHERLYHIFLLGILSAYDDVHCGYPLSNRESGDGRYDILVKKSNENFIFEFKASDRADNLTEKAQEALNQIEIKRYGTDLGDKKRLVKVGVAFHGKLCCVKCN